MRHRFYRRLGAVLIVLLVFAQMTQVAVSYHKKLKEASMTGQNAEPEKLTLWYTDEKLNAYLVKAASAFPIWEDLIFLSPPASFLRKRVWLELPWKTTAFRKESWRTSTLRRHYPPLPVRES